MIFESRAATAEAVDETLLDAPLDAVHARPLGVGYQFAISCPK
jgi:hypothetical protein